MKRTGQTDPMLAFKFHVFHAANYPQEEIMIEEIMLISL